MMFFKKKPKAAILLEKKIKGHTYRVLDPARMPVIRAKALSVEMYKQDWGIDKRDLTLYLNKCVDLIVKSKEMDAVHLIKSLLSLIQGDFQRPAFLSLASLIVLIDNEVPDDLDESIRDRKYNMCDRYPEVNDFFLSQIIPLVINIRNTSNESDIWESSKAEWLKKTEKVIYEQIEALRLSIT